MKRIVEVNERTNETITRVFDDKDVPVSVVGVHNVTGKIRYIYPQHVRRFVSDLPFDEGGIDKIDTKELHYDPVYIRRRLNSARTSAKNRGIPFHIGTKDIRDLLKAQENRCYYTGLPFIDARGSDRLGAQNKFGFSIDRLDSTKGYTRDNIALCLNIINTCKGSRSADEYITQCYKETKDAYRAVGWDKEPTAADIFGYAFKSGEYTRAMRKMRGARKAGN